MKLLKITTVLSSIFFIIALLACNGIQQVTPPTETQALTISPTPQITATHAPTPTELPPLVVLLATEESEMTLTEELSPVLEELVSQAGMRFETRQALSIADIEAGSIAIVVALPGVQGFSDLVESAPQTQFLGIGYNDLEVGPNLSLLKSSSNQEGELAFISGFVAAVVTPDWRAGVFFETGTGVGEITRRAFSNGLYYFCGLCRSVYPPYPVPGYPLYYELPAGASSTEWEAGMNYFKEWQVVTVYVPKPLDGDDFLMALSQAGFNLIANRQPPPGMATRWIATVSSADAAQEIIKVWPQLLSRTGGQMVELSTGIEAANPELFSPGRQNLVRNMIDDLNNGYIDTGTGEPGGNGP